jgi:hypothetical protein
MHRLIPVSKYNFPCIVPDEDGEQFGRIIKREGDNYLVALVDNRDGVWFPVANVEIGNATTIDPGFSLPVRQ